MSSLIPTITHVLLAALGHVCLPVCLTTCLSVHPFITHWYCIKTNDCNVVPLLPTGSPGTSFLRATFIPKVPGEHPEPGLQTRLGVVKNVVWPTILFQSLIESPGDLTKNDIGDYLKCPLMVISYNINGFIVCLKKITYVMYEVDYNGQTSYIYVTGRTVL